MASGPIQPLSVPSIGEITKLHRSGAATLSGTGPATFQR